MNEYQNKIYQLAQKENIGKLSLRQIAILIGASGKPQIVKHHLLQLDKKGLLKVNLEENIIEVTKRGVLKMSGNANIFSLPIVGSANCGPANIFADERIEGYLKISSKKLPRNKKELYVLIASGNSMNNTNIDGKNIEDGDYVIIDKNYPTPKTGDVVVSVIDGMANIKKFYWDQKNSEFILVSESIEKGHPPIIIHKDDDFIVIGKIIDVIKKPK